MQASTSGAQPSDWFAGAPRLSAWLASCLAGRTAPDDLVDQIGSAMVFDPLTGSRDSLVSLVGEFVRSGATGCSLALPTPGDPLGLNGPAEFNQIAIEAGSAVLIAGGDRALVPTGYDGLWRLHPADRARPLDPTEAGVTLRETLLQTTRQLADLQVARWRPEVADLLMNQHQRDPLPLPPVPARLRESAERAVLCLEIVELALLDDGASLSSAQIQQRREALVDLDRAARRALVSVCSTL